MSWDMWHQWGIGFHTDGIMSHVLKEFLNKHSETAAKYRQIAVQSKLIPDAHILNNNIVLPFQINPSCQNKPIDALISSGISCAMLPLLTTRISKCFPGKCIR